MIKKVHWIEKTDSNWRLLIKLNSEIYRIRILTNCKYGLEYTLYKFERYNEADDQWTADARKGNTQITSDVPYSVISNVRLISVEHIKECRPAIVIYLINKNDSLLKQRSRVYALLLKYVEGLGYKAYITDLFDLRVYIGISEKSNFFNRPFSDLKKKMWQIYYPNG